MTDTPAMLDFVKATSDANRLRIIGALARRPATVNEIARELDMPFRQVFNHLAYLEFAEVVYKTADIFSLDDHAIESLSKAEFADKHKAFVPAPDLDPKTRRVLAGHLNADGTIRQLPIQPSKLRAILNYLIPAFTFGEDYTEVEVNAILHRFHDDTARLRRELVEAGLLARESNGSRYWRVRQETEGKPS